MMTIDSKKLSNNYLFIHRKDSKILVISYMDTNELPDSKNNIFQNAGSFASGDIDSLLAEFASSLRLDLNQSINETTNIIFKVGDILYCLI